MGRCRIRWRFSFLRRRFRISQHPVTPAPGGAAEGLPDRVERLAREAADHAGVRLAWIEIKGPRAGRRVRVFIERHADRVGLEDCERVNRVLSTLLDADDPFPGPYTLEVSTPGLFRPLRSLEDCRRFVGRRVRVRFRDAEGTHEMTAVMSRVEDRALHLDASSGSRSVGWPSIEAARLDPDLDALLRRHP